MVQPARPGSPGSRLPLPFRSSYLTPVICGIGPGPPPGEKLPHTSEMNAPPQVRVVIGPEPIASLTGWKPTMFEHGSVCGASKHDDHVRLAGSSWAVGAQSRKLASKLRAGFS